MNDHRDDIKSMGLYHHVNRVANELRELGRADGEPLRVDDLTSFDQLHYHGTEAVDEAIGATGIGDRSSVLEIGSGLGGPARYLAAASGAAVTALELQEDHHQMATDLTGRCGLDDRVTHVFGDFLTHPWAGERFDAIVSWLALYHIPRREALLQRCRSLLGGGGFVYVEDLYARRSFDDREWADLSSELSASYLPNLEQYRQDFVDAGFELDRVDDMSEDWTEFTGTRLTAYRAAKDRHLRVHGEEVFETMCTFYDTMVRLFSGGKLGGVRLVARRL
jgi:cyclopropane fatty-acyl-phospholipid synthase-like methyltransferase